MAALTTVRLAKGDAPSWGFRLQGGKDFGTPLLIQKVNGGSPAERAGLVAGDAVIKINNTDVFNLLHKDAQDVIVRAGNSFDMTIQRGGSTWRPSVVPVGSVKPPAAANSVRPVTKTSLAARPGENIGAIGTGHNVSAQPFAPQLNGAVNGGPKLVNKQYNTPLKLYSEDAIAETLSAQTEVLSTGALGVNFKKNEKNYDATNSAVYRMLQEAENDPRSPTTEVISNAANTQYYSHQSHAIGGRRTVTPRPTTPCDRPADTSQRAEAPETGKSPAEGATVCSDCERVIVGVFVRIKDKNLHVECFKCSTCGTSLKNVGYYNINNKLYCDVHAKAAARSNPAALGGSPYTPAPPGAPANAISQALQTHSLVAPLSPKANSYQLNESENADVSPAPLHTISSESNSNKITNNNLYSSPAPVPFSKYLNKSAPSYSSAPKPFSSVGSPLSPGGTLPRAGPLSPASTLPRAPLSPAAAPAPAPSFTSYSPASSAGRYSSIKPTSAPFKGRSVQNIVWPPPPEEPDVPTACPLFYPPPSQVEASILSRREQRTRSESENYEENLEVQEITAMAGYQPYYSEEFSFSGRKSATECVEILSETLETQKLVESIVQQQPRDPQMSEPTTEVAFPPAKQLKDERQRDSPELKRPTQYSPNTVECQLPSKVDNVVPQKWESPMTQVFRTTHPDADTFAQIPTKRSGSALASALSTAPDTPFTPLPPHSLQPVPLPEETEPYFPPQRSIISEKKSEETPAKKVEPKKPDSPFVQALKVAPDRPFTPVGGASPAPVKKKAKDPTEKFFADLPKPTEKLDMRSALTTAPDRPYSPLVTESAGAVKAAVQNPKSSNPGGDRSQLSKPLKPEILPESFKMNKKQPKPPSYYPPSILYEATQESHSEELKKESESKQTTITETQTIHPAKTSQILVQNQARETPTAFAPLFHGFSCSFQNKTDHSHFSVEISTTPPVPTPPPKPQTPLSYIATVEEKPSIITKQIVTEERRAAEQSSKKQEKSREELKITQIPRQAEEVVKVKPVPVSAMLRKAEALPQYQIELQQTAEADLRYMEKMERAHAAHKTQQQQHVSFKEQTTSISEERKREEIRIEEERRRQEERKREEIRIEEERRRQEERKREELRIEEARRRQEERKREEIRIEEERRRQEERKREELRIEEARRRQEERKREEIRIEEERRRQEERKREELRIEEARRRQEERKREELRFEEERRQQISIREKQERHLRAQQQHIQQVTESRSTMKPIITLQPGDSNPMQPHLTFQPVVDDKPQNLTFSPRPRPLTPSMIQKPPPVLPYYQTNLVAQHQAPAQTYLLDPRSPGVSRTPSPCPDRRSPSPFLSKGREERSKSPAAGPPSNPLHSPKPLPTPDSSRVEVAKQNLTTFIPEYMSKRELVEQTRGMDFYKKQEKGEGTRMYASQMQSSAQSYPMQRRGSSYQSVSTSSQHVDDHEQVYQQQKMEMQDAQRAAAYVSQSEHGVCQTAISEKTHQDNLEALKKSQSSSVERSADGRKQIQRKKTVTEEYESSHKEQTMEIQRQSITTKAHQYPFTSVKNPEVEVPAIKGHATNPQPIGFKKRCQKCCQASCGCCCSVAQPSPAEDRSQVPFQPATRPVFAPPNPVKHVSAPGVSCKPGGGVTVPKPNAGVGGGRQAGGISITPKRGRGVLNTAAIGGTRVPLCGSCHGQIRGPFITALGKIWCPQHFVCATPSCRRPLQDLGFVEEKGQLYCEYCFEQYLAPPCSKCSGKIKGDCLKAIGKNFHPECFNCTYCGKLFGNSPFFLEDGSPYCEADWNELFTTKCYACGFPVEAGDRWVEALNNNYHSQCFNCTMCKKNLEGQSFFAKGGRPFCKNHAR